MAANEFIYVIAGLGFVKVGYSSDPQRRAKGISHGIGHAVSVVAFERVPCGTGYKAERAAHDMLSAHRVFGEWFDVPADVAVDAIRQAAEAFSDKGVNLPMPIYRGRMRPRMMAMGRVLANMSQGDLADAAGISRVTVSNYERGGMTMTGNLARMIAAIETRGVRFHDDGHRIGASAPRMPPTNRAAPGAAAKEM